MHDPQRRARRPRLAGDQALLDLFTETARWRRILRCREGWLLNAEEADAEIAAAVWELIRAGETDHRLLYIGASRRLWTMRRREYRARGLASRIAAATPRAGHTRRIVFERFEAEPVPVDIAADPLDAAVDRIAASQTLDQVGLPDRAVPWFEQRFTDLPARQLTSADYKAGKRWFRAITDEVLGAA